MWLTLIVLVVSGVLLWREARALRGGMSSRRQLVLRIVGCALLLILALVLQFKDVIVPPANTASDGARLLRLLQLTIGIFVLVMALVLVALLDARETLQRYLRERRRMIDDLIQASPQSPEPPSDDGWS